MMSKIWPLYRCRKCFLEFQLQRNRADGKLEPVEFDEADGSVAIDLLITGAASRIPPVSKHKCDGKTIGVGDFVAIEYGH